MTQEFDTKIHHLWDQIVDLPVSGNTSRLQFLLRSLSEFIDAHQAYWLGCVRLNNIPDDPARGWRPSAVEFLHNNAASNGVYQAGMEEVSGGQISETVDFHTRNAGKFRSHLIREIISSDYHQSSHHNVREKLFPTSDTLYVIAPVNRDTECYFGFHRTDGSQFSPEDKVIASRALRPLKWFYRQLMLQHGLVLADKPLTLTERKVMKLMITDLSEKQIAEHLVKKQDTIHQHVKSIYRKFNVNSRAALLALWLGHEPQ